MRKGMLLKGVCEEGGLEASGWWELGMQGKVRRGLDVAKGSLSRGRI